MKTMAITSGVFHLNFVVLSQVKVVTKSIIKIMDDLNLFLSKHLTFSKLVTTQA